MTHWIPWLHVHSLSEDWDFDYNQVPQEFFGLLRSVLNEIRARNNSLLPCHFLPISDLAFKTTIYVQTMIECYCMQPDGICGAVFFDKFSSSFVSFQIYSEHLQLSATALCGQTQSHEQTFRGMSS